MYGVGEAFIHTFVNYDKPLKRQRLENSRRIQYPTANRNIFRVVQQHLLMWCPQRLHNNPRVSSVFLHKGIHYFDIVLNEI